MNLQEEIKALKQRIAELEERAKVEQEFPQDGDEYWYVDYDAEVLNMEWKNDEFDQGRLTIGNVFKTKQQAGFAVEKLKVEAELRKFSRPFLWGTENTAILFDGYDFKFDTRLAYVFQGVIYFESRAKAKQAIQAVGEERIKKYIFGVEE